MLASQVANLRLPLGIPLGGQTYPVPGRSYQRWAAALCEPVPLLGLLDFEVAREVSARIWDPDDVLDTEDLREGWRDVLDTHTGQPWWVALRLLAITIDAHPTMAYLMARRGHDMLTAPVDLVLAFTLGVILEIPEKDRLAVERDLFLVPPEVFTEATPSQPPPGFSPEEQGAAWVAAAAARPLPAAPPT